MSRNGGRTHIGVYGPSPWGIDHADHTGLPFVREAVPRPRRIRREAREVPLLRGGGFRSYCGGGCRAIRLKSPSPATGCSRRDAGTGTRFGSCRLGYRRGRCLIRDIHDRVAEVQIDVVDPEWLRVLDTTPRAHVA